MVSESDICNELIILEEFEHPGIAASIKNAVGYTKRVDGGIINPLGNIDGFDCGKWYNRPSSIENKIIDNTFEDNIVVSLVQIYNNFFQHITFDTLPKLRLVKKFAITMAVL